MAPTDPNPIEKQQSMNNLSAQIPKRLVFNVPGLPIPMLLSIVFYPQPRFATPFMLWQDARHGLRSIAFSSLFAESRGLRSLEFKDNKARGYDWQIIAGLTGRGRSHGMNKNEKATKIINLAMDLSSIPHLSIRLATIAKHFSSKLSLSRMKTQRFLPFRRRNCMWDPPIVR